MRHTVFFSVAIAVGSLMFGTTVSADTVVVTPSNMNGWTFQKTGPTGTIGTGDATTEMVTGPAGQPLGTGSAHFDTNTNGFQTAQLRTGTYNGTLLSAITALSYSTYAADWNGQQVPYITIYIDSNNDNVRDDRIWFEPDYTSNSTALNVWQTWNAFAGQWYSDDPSDAFAAGFGTTGTLAAYIATKPNAKIFNEGGLGGIRLASGGASVGNHFNTNVDAFTIDTGSGPTTYDFEPEAVPDLGSTAGLLAGALSFMTVLRRKLSR